MEYDLPFPDVKGRKYFPPMWLQRGSVVAFEMKDFNSFRTGIIVMDSPRYMKLAYNMFKELGNMWVEEDLPQDNIRFYEANEEETLWGLNKFMQIEYGGTDIRNGYNPFITFIDRECPKSDDEEASKGKFCIEMLTRVPMLLERSKWAELKDSVIEKFKQAGGLQFNRFQVEYYCFMIGVLMIAEYSRDEERRLIRTELFIKEWDQFSWMYGMGLGRVIGSRLHNFTAVINQTGLNNRKHYLHLYLPMAERFKEKMLRYNDDKPDKLEKAIEKARMVEVREEQKTDLDELYGILFPTPYQDAMSANRPASTIAQMKQEMKDKEIRIKELEGAVDDLSSRYDLVLKQLTEAVGDVESDRISAEDLTAAFLRLPAELALSFFGSISTLLAQNLTWQRCAPRINQQILAKAGNSSTINVQGDYVLNKHVDNEVDKVEPGATGIYVK